MKIDLLVHVTNNRPFLPKCIAEYKRLGFDPFFVLDENADGTALSHAAAIPMNSSAPERYLNEAVTWLRRHRGTDWVVFVEGDEFPLFARPSIEQYVNSHPEAEAFHYRVIYVAPDLVSYWKNPPGGLRFRHAHVFRANPDCFVVGRDTPGLNPYVVRHGSAADTHLEVVSYRFTVPFLVRETVARKCAVLLRKFPDLELFEAVRRHRDWWSEDGREYAELDVGILKQAALHPEIDFANSATHRSYIEAEARYYHYATFSEQIKNPFGYPLADRHESDSVVLPGGLRLIHHPGEGVKLGLPAISGTVARIREHFRKPVDVKFAEDPPEPPAPADEIETGVDVQKKKIVACLNCKNEEQIIGKFLTRLSEIVDEIVVIDDGSTDRTVEIVRQFPSVVDLHVKKPSNVRRQTRDRNLLLKMARKRNPDWIMIYIDADELPVPALAEYIRFLVNNGQGVENFHFRKLTPWRGVEHHRIDSKKFYTVKSPCLVKNSPALAWRLKPRRFLRFIPRLPWKHHHGAGYLAGTRGRTMLIESLPILHYSHVDFDELTQKVIRYALWQVLDDRKRNLRKVLLGFEDLFDEDGLKTRPVPKEWL